MQTNIKKWFILVIILIVLFILYLFLFNKEEEKGLGENKIENENSILEFEKLDIKESSVMEDDYDLNGTLVDVTAGKIIRNINTEGKAEGAVESRFKDNKYELRATFVNLPEPTGTDFYEGWIVRKGENMDVVSTKSLSRINGEWVNVFESDEDLSDHTFYVVTLEPYDNNPLPYDSHILEGYLD